MHGMSLERLIEAGKALDHAETVPPVPDRDGATTLPPAPLRPVRRHARVPYHLQVTLYGPTTFCSGVVRNLSESGAFVETNWPFAVDTPVEFVLDLPDDTHVVRGIVRWRRCRGGPAARPGMGVELVGLTDAQLASLRSFVAVCSDR